MNATLNEKLKQAKVELFLCGLCNRGFTSKQSLMYHQQNKVHEKQAQCERIANKEQAQREHIANEKQAQCERIANK